MRWRAVPAVAAPVEVPAASAPRYVSGLAVGETRRAAFATPTAGWAMVGAPAVCWLLYTEDLGDAYHAAGDPAAAHDARHLAQTILDEFDPA
jgi:hypothetical protein